MKFEHHEEKLEGAYSIGRRNFHSISCLQSRFDDPQVEQMADGSLVVDGWIVPEPMPWDKYAKAVYIKAPTGKGTQHALFSVGHLEKNGWLYNRVKVCSQKWEPCRVKVPNSDEQCTVIVGEA